MHDDGMAGIESTIRTEQEESIYNLWLVELGNGTPPQQLTQARQFVAGMGIE
jgi:hypothetical protein